MPGLESDSTQTRKVVMIDMSKVPPEIRFTGTWRGRDVMAAQRSLAKAYRLRVAQLRKEGVNSGK